MPVLVFQIPYSHLMKLFTVPLCLAALLLVVAACESPSTSDSKDKPQSDELAYVDSLLAGRNQPGNSLLVAIVDAKRDTTFTLSQPSIPTPANDRTDFFALFDNSKYAPDFNPTLNIKVSNTGYAMELLRMKGTGKFELSEPNLPGSNELAYRFPPYYYEYRSQAGVVIVTEFDTANRIFSAKFDAIVVRNADTLRAIGRYHRLELYTVSALSTGKLIYDLSPYSHNSVYAGTEDKLYINGEFSRKLSCVDRFGSHGSELHTLALVLPQPGVRTYKATDAQWKWDKEIQWPSFCRDTPGNASAGGSDSLVVTHWNPSGQLISGKFTIGGVEGQFINLPWRRHP
jgi:hypothetical protein